MSPVLGVNPLGDDGAHNMATGTDPSHFQLCQRRRTCDHRRTVDVLDQRRVAGCQDHMHSSGADYEGEEFRVEGFIKN